MFICNTCKPKKDNWRHANELDFVVFQNLPKFKEPHLHSISIHALADRNHEQTNKHIDGFRLLQETNRIKYKKNVSNAANAHSRIEGREGWT